MASLETKNSDLSLNSEFKLELQLAAVAQPARSQMELCDAVRQLSLAHPDMGVKKMAATIKQQHPHIQGGSKEVRVVLQQVKEQLANESPAVSPSASPGSTADATDASGTMGSLDEVQETGRQMKARLRKEAALEAKARATRKNAAFKKLFPDINLGKAFGKGVDRRQQKASLDVLKMKLTDPTYLAGVMATNALSAEDLAELVHDMKEGGFTPSAPDSEDSDGEQDGERQQQLEQTGENAGQTASVPDLPRFGAQADSGALSLPSFGNQA